MIVLYVKIKLLQNSYCIYIKFVSEICSRPIIESMHDIHEFCTYLFSRILIISGGSDWFCAAVSATLCNETPAVTRYGAKAD